MQAVEVSYDQLYYDFLKVKGFLQYGDQKQIAEDHKVTIVYVSYVANRKRDSWKILFDLFNKACANKASHQISQKLIDIANS